MRVVDLQIVGQAGIKIAGRIVIAALEKPPCQDAKPQLYLIQPGAMRGRKVKDMLMRRITQERAALASTRQGLGRTWEITPRCDKATHVQAPVGIEIVHPPIIALHRGELVDHIGQMGSPIRTGAGLAQIPHEVPRWHHEGGQ